MTQFCGTIPEARASYEKALAMASQEPERRFLAKRLAELKILFLSDIVHALRVQLQHPEVTAIFDIDQTAAAATRQQLLPRLASEDIVIAGPHMNFPALGRLRKEGRGYSWAPVVFTDRWDDR